VLPRPEESLAVKHDDGARGEDEIEGYELQGDQVKLRLTQKGLVDLGIELFNARDEGAGALPQPTNSAEFSSEFFYNIQQRRLATEIGQGIKDNCDRKKCVNAKPRRSQHRGHPTSRREKSASPRSIRTSKEILTYH